MCVCVCVGQMKTNADNDYDMSKAHRVHKIRRCSCYESYDIIILIRLDLNQDQVSFPLQ